MANLIAGWMMFYFFAWLCWAVGAPIVAEAAREPVVYQHICPMLEIRHGVGSDLRTTTMVRDLCAI